jgi:hypothetical protein
LEHGPVVVDQFFGQFISPFSEILRGPVPGELVSLARASCDESGSNDKTGGRKRRQMLGEEKEEAEEVKETSMKRKKERESGKRRENRS